MKQLTSTDSILPDDFFTGDKPVRTKDLSLKVGQNVVAREVLALETTTGLYVTYAEGGANGTGVAAAIAAYDTDATGAETVVQAYSEGSFNPEKLIFSGTPSDLQKANMFVDSPIVLQTPQG